MKRLILAASVAVLLWQCDTQKEETPMLNYPETKKVGVVDTYFGTPVPDPYRWLEDDRSAETEAWVKAQNEVTFGYLNSIPYKDDIKQRLEALWNYPKRSAPRKDGGYYFFYTNNGLQNQYVLNKQDDLDSDPEVFIDPNTWSEDGTVTLAGFNVKDDGTYAAYGIQRSGSDWVDYQVMSMENRQDVGDTIRWIKFGGVSWFEDGFFYSRFPAPEEGAEYSSQNQNQAVYYHKLGEPQSADKLIYEDPTKPLQYKFAGTTEDEHFLILNLSEGTSGNRLAIKDLTQGMDAPFVFLNEGFENDHSIIDHINGDLLIYTNLNAPNYRLVKVDAANPTTDNWVDVLPNQEDKVLSSVRVLKGNQLLVQYMEDASDYLYIYDYDGNLKKEIALPTIGSVGGVSTDKEDDFFFYSFTSFTYPSVIYKYDLNTNAQEVFFQPELKFNPDDYETKQVFFESKDGTQVPMFLTMKKGLELDGQRPTYLYAYGGFNISLTPSFNPSNLILMDQGGVYALANLRGGGEYGEAWHKAGMLQNKQNVFDDFIAAGEYLINEKYTSSDKLAIAGGSNGGLLVGACMTQRPELFAVAFPAVGVMDMLRFHKFTVGFGWVVEYGSSDNEEDFKNLYAYSPLHNLEEGVEYPATMVTTADHDDRVVPAHSFKFAATLQEKHAGENPVLIRIETKAGHGGGKPVSMIIEEQADKWAFMFKNTNVDYK